MNKMSLSERYPAIGRNWMPSLSRSMGPRVRLTPREWVQFVAVVASAAAVGVILALLFQM